MNRIYLDHNATTPVDPRVLEHFVATERTCPGNPSSAHATGRHARSVLENARARIAADLAVDHDAVVFVSGGTEANNIAVLGLGPTTHAVVASAAEHPSAREAARRRGCIELPLDAAGRPRFAREFVSTESMSIESAPASVRGVAVVCAVYGQSEVGSLSDVVAARAFADSLGAALHIDASQALGREHLAPALAVADTLALSLHKAGGLRGVGLLIVRRARHHLRALGAGGSQETGRRPGTVSPALATAAAYAVGFAVHEQHERAAAMDRARDAFWQVLASTPGVERISPTTQVVPNTLMLAFRAVPDGRALLPAFDLAGVDASHGSACSSGSPQPPAVLRAMGYDELTARKCVRFSFSHLTMLDAAQQAAHRVVDAVMRLGRARQDHHRP